jgi:hypothetical protein
MWAPKALKVVSDNGVRFFSSSCLVLCAFRDRVLLQASLKSLSGQARHAYPVNWELVCELGICPRRQLVYDCRIPSCTFQAEGLLGGFSNSTADGKFPESFLTIISQHRTSKVAAADARNPDQSFGSLLTVGASPQYPLAFLLHSTDDEHISIIHTKYLVPYLDFAKFAYCPSRDLTSVSPRCSRCPLVCFLTISITMFLSNPPCPRVAESQFDGS